MKSALIKVRELKATLNTGQKADTEKVSNAVEVLREASAHVASNSLEEFSFLLLKLGEQEVLSSRETKSNSTLVALA